MRECLHFYIDGRWVEPAGSDKCDVVNPATGMLAGRISLGTAGDVDMAVAAARRAFAEARMTRTERIDLLKRVLAEYERRSADLAAAVTEEMGAPASLARDAHVALGSGHLQAAISVLESYAFDETRHGTTITKEPIGVCGMITPWNWPINQIAAKVAPALAVGCTMVLKPSELSPFSAYIWTEIMDAAGAPAGLFNMINGHGPVVGAAIAGHEDVDMVSFTGSTRAGVEVARAAAPTVKRVHQELGGKSPNVLLDDVDLGQAVAEGVRAVMMNSGQTCNAPTRMLVPHARMEEAMEIAASTAEATIVGTPADIVDLGPVVSENQWTKIQDLIGVGMAEGAELVAGGRGRPDGLDRGYFVKPTIFANVRNDMRIAQEEIFGPVLVIIGYEDEEDAISIANDSPYGLAAYVQSSDVERARGIARRLRAGQVFINGAGFDLMAPFGGYKRSGNGREWGDHAFAEYLEVKAILGYGEATATA